MFFLFLPSGLSASSPLQHPLARSGTSPAFNPSRSSSPQVRGGSSAPSPHKQLAHSRQQGNHGAVRKGKGPGDHGARWWAHHTQDGCVHTYTSHCDPQRTPMPKLINREWCQIHSMSLLAKQLQGLSSHTHSLEFFQTTVSTSLHLSWFSFSSAQIWASGQSLPFVVTRVFPSALWKTDRFIFFFYDRKLQLRYHNKDTNRTRTSGVRVSLKCTEPRLPFLLCYRSSRMLFKCSADTFIGGWFCTSPSLMWTITNPRHQTAFLLKFLFF